MSRVVTTQIRDGWAEVTCRHDHEETCKELYKIAERLLLHVHGDDPHVPVIAADIAARALTRFGEKMPKQIEAMMQKILADALFAGFDDYISDQTKRGLSPRDARAVQASLRKVNQKMTVSAQRQVWGVPQHGRSNSFADEAIKAAVFEQLEQLEHEGSGHVSQKVVANKLNCGVTTIQDWLAESGLSWKQFVAQVKAETRK